MNGIISSRYNLRSSRAIFSFQTKDYDELGLTARTGQVGTHARATNMTALDRNGTARAVVKNQPAIQMTDLDADSIRESPLMLLNYDSLLSFPFLRKPGPMTGLLDFVITSDWVSGDTAFSIYKSDLTGAGLFLDVSSGAGDHLFYIEHYNGVNTTVHSNTGVNAHVGERVRLRWEVFPDASVKIHQTINSGAEVAGTTSSGIPAAGFAAAWGDTVLWINSRGASAPGKGSYQKLIIVEGAGRTLDQFEEIG